MAYRKKTIRTMPETTRDLAKLINELASIERRLKNMLPRVRALERDSNALKRHSCRETVKENQALTMLNQVSS